MDQTAEIDALKRRLIEFEARHRLLIGSWAQAEWEADAAGVVTADSPSWRAYTGQTLEEWLGYGWLDAIHPEDRAYAEHQWREATAARRLVDAEFRLSAPGGGWRWTNVRAVPLLDDAGRIEKWAALNIDIDNRKRAEAALRQSEERYRVLFECMDEGVVTFDVILDVDGKAEDALYLESNTAFSRMTGLTADIVGKRMREVFPNLEPFWFEALERIVATGEPARFEHTVYDLEDKWFDCFASRVGGEGSTRIVVVFNNITTRKHTETFLRESEERQAFLLRLSDALRGQPDADATANRALHMLSEQMGLDRCYIAAFHIEKDWAEYLHQVGNDRIPPMPEGVRLSAFPKGMQVAADRSLVIDDLLNDTSLTEMERRSIGAFAHRALVAAFLRKGERHVLWTLCAVTATPRHWTPGEIALVEETAERTWAAIERVRSEAALRESEGRFREFANASLAALWIRDAATLSMEYVSPAIGTIYGIEPDALLGPVEKWASMIVPDDRDIALAHIEKARSGKATVHEFRIQRPADGAFRWIRNTDFPLRDDGNIPRIGGIAADVTEAKLAAEHSAILLAELQHRVRNIMALLRSITNRTAERADSVPEYRDLMMGRLLAFARVQALLTRAANASVGIAAVIHDEISVQAGHEGQYVLDGPDIKLSPKAAEVLTLAIHELATNAVKYGALSVPGGRVTVRWSTFEKRGGPWLAFDWTEDGAPSRLAPAAPDTPRRRGFGSELIEGRIPYELKGRGQVTIEPGGARCHLEFPLREMTSILQTSAPQRAAVFGGMIDMTGEPDLTGRRILVVEDDYYLATDTARALRGAGAEVLGPYATEEDAQAELAEQRPDAVVVDVNLGLGPSFKLARRLKDGDIPFVFTTGYDAGVIPAEFEGVERLEKPLQLRQIVGAVASLTMVA